jgi:uncharacterized protein YwqG
MKIFGIVLVFLLVSAALLWYVKNAKTPAPVGQPAAKEREATSADLAAFLQPVQSKLAASQRQAAHIAFYPLTADDPGISKLGGAAYWPKHEAPPVDIDGKPLHLLAQIRLADLPESLGFPAAGMLQFFIQSNDYYGANFDDEMSINALSKQRYFKVVHWQSIAADYGALAAHEAEMLPHRSSQAFGMRFEARPEQITVGDFRFGAIFAQGDYVHAAESFAAKQGISEDSLMDLLYTQLGGNGHKLGGYPFFTQEDPRREQGYELLFQLDTDDAVNMMWGDVGVANFFIKPADLQRGDFSNVAYNWDCH